jgi:hypothetical protein
MGEEHGEPRLCPETLVPQNPAPVPTPESKIPSKPPNPDCDKKLAAPFGGPGAVAAGSGYEPPGMQGPQGGPNFRPHVYRTLHIYGNELLTTIAEPTPSQRCAQVSGGCEEFWEMRAAG